MNLILYSIHPPPQIRLPNPSIRNRRKIQRNLYTTRQLRLRHPRRREIDMESRGRITIPGSRIAHAEDIRITRAGADRQRQVEASGAIVQWRAHEGGVGICHPGVPVELSVRGACDGAVPGVVGDGVEHAGGGDLEDFAFGLGVVVVCHVGGGVGEGPAGAGVGITVDLEVVRGA